MKTIAAALAGGMVVGGIGFVGGFIGPMILTPDANQGPLLGILITGPIGFVLGSIGGGVASVLATGAGSSTGKGAAVAVHL